MRTGNPALTARTFASSGRAVTGEEAMTVQGTVNKTGLLLLLLEHDLKLLVGQETEVDENLSDAT